MAPHTLGRGSGAVTRGAVAIVAAATLSSCGAPPDEIPYFLRVDDSTAVATMGKDPRKLSNVTVWLVRHDPATDVDDSIALPANASDASEMPYDEVRDGLQISIEGLEPGWYDVWIEWDGLFGLRRHVSDTYADLPVDCTKLPNPSGALALRARCPGD